MPLNVNLFITPLIVLLLVLWCYFYFRKRAKDIGIYHRYLALTGALAFFLNWEWELAQGFLYQGFEYDLEHILVCGLASVADMLMVYLLLFGFGLIYRDFFWIRNLSELRIFWLMLTGSIGAILSEWRHTW